MSRENSPSSLTHREPVEALLTELIERSAIPSVRDTGLDAVAFPEFGIALATDSKVAICQSELNQQWFNLMHRPTECLEETLTFLDYDDAHSVLVLEMERQKSVTLRECEAAWTARENEAVDEVLVKQQTENLARDWRKEKIQQQVVRHALKSGSTARASE